MTVIVAARSKKGVIVAADSLTTAGWQKLNNDRSKLWKADPFVFGAAGDMRTAQVIQHWATWPKYRADEDTNLEAFAVKSIVPAIRKSVEGAGVTTTTSGVDRIDTSLIVAWDDHLMTIHGNGCVTIPTDGRCAIGSGYAEALGYLGEKGPWTVEQVVEAARRATITAVGVDGPIDYIVTGGELVRGAA